MEKTRLNIRINSYLYLRAYELCNKYKIDISDYLTCLVIDELHDIKVAREQIHNICPEFLNITFDREDIDLESTKDTTQLNIYLPEDLLKTLKESVENRTKENEKAETFPAKVSLNNMFNFILAKDLTKDTTARPYRAYKDKTYYDYLIKNQIVNMPRVRPHEEGKDTFTERCRENAEKFCREMADTCK